MICICHSWHVDVGQLARAAVMDMPVPVINTYDHPSSLWTNNQSVLQQFVQETWLSEKWRQWSLFVYIAV